MPSDCSDKSLNNFIKKLGFDKFSKELIQTAFTHSSFTKEQDLPYTKCYERLGNDTKVRDSYENAVRLNPTYVQAFLSYAKYLISQEEYADAQRKLRKALKADSENIELLNLMFYVSYILVKNNVYEYNVKETLSVAEKIEKINPDLFKYPEQKQELTMLLNHAEERK